MDGVDGMGRELVCRSISVLVWRGASLFMLVSGGIYAL